MAKEQQPAIHEQDTPPIPTYSQTPLTQAMRPPIPADISTAHSGVLIRHTPPLVAQTTSNLVDSTRFTVLEGMVNQLATNMATNMTELMAILREQNRSSSSFTPLPEHRPIVDPNPVIPLIHVTDSEDISFSAMAYVPTVHPISDPLPPPPAPTAVPLPPPAFLSADSTMHALPPLAMPVRPPIYTVPPLTIALVISAQALVSTMDHFPFQAPQPQISFSYPAPSPLNIPPTEPGMPTQAAPTPPPINFLPETDTEQETNKALQAGNSHFDYSDSDWNLFPSMRLPPKIKIPDFKRYDGTRDPQHHLRHYQSKMLSYWDYEEFVIQTFQDSLMGSTLDWFMTLKAGDVPTWIDLSHKFLDHRNRHISMTLLRFSKAEPQFRDLLSRLNGPLLHRLNRVALLNPINANHGSSSGPSINMISIAAIGEEDDLQETLVPFIIDYAPAEVAFTSAPFVIEVLVKEPYQDHRVPWDYGDEVANMEQEMSTMGITHSGRVYQGLESGDKGKAPAAAFLAISEAAPHPAKKVIEQEAEAFMKVIKASEYKVVKQMGKSPAHISLLALLLSSEPHRDALLKVLTAAQVPKEITPDRIEQTMNYVKLSQGIPDPPL
ncbi:hypothetical protein CRG98_019912 [Punica granatum]|uniref:Retrotransposon gag domain-containing protein n=1 Tax=Punica granatum TaxID=22663 RepID=A0A2I0JW87_PUNGR|nr:hypothetical protein CRG98_019912 [Punica granatum]